MSYSHRANAKVTLESIFYVACYFGKGIYVERLTNQDTRVIAPLK